MKITISKAIRLNHKYYKREGVNGSYKYYYTKDEYDKRNSQNKNKGSNNKSKIFVGYRNKKSADVGKYGTFYNVTKPKFYETNEVKLEFKNPLILTQKEVEPFEGLSLETLFEKWFSNDYDLRGEAKKQGIETGELIDKLVTKEAIKRGYDGIICGKQEIIDLKTHKDFNKKDIKPIKQTETKEFKDWFGDSKVVDKKGNPKETYPIKVYHGTIEKFTIFDPEKIGSGTGNFGHYGKGFYFSVDKREANTYTDEKKPNILECFLSIQNPFYANKLEHLELIAKDFGYIKEPVAVDGNWILNKLKNTDKIAYELFDYSLKYGQIDAWEKLRENHNNTIPESKLDLNDISNWLEWSDKESETSLPNWVLDEIENYLGEKPPIIEGYTTGNYPNLLYITDLGNNSEYVTKLIKKYGFDGIIAGSEIVAFKPTQIKSATGNNGQFNPNNSDITKSIKNNIMKKSLNITFNLDILKAYAQSEATIKFKSDNPTARIEQLKLNDVKEQLKHWYKEQDEHSRKLVKKFKKQDLSKHPPAIVEKLDSGKYIILDGHHHLKAAIKQGLETYPAYVSKGYAKDMDSFGKNNMQKSIIKGRKAEPIGSISKDGKRKKVGVDKWAEVDKFSIGEKKQLNSTKKIIKTSSKYKQIHNSLLNFLKLNNIEFDDIKAKSTQSFYTSFYYKNNNYKIRISDHSKAFEYSEDLSNIKVDFDSYSNNFDVNIDNSYPYVLNSKDIIKTIQIIDSYSKELLNSELFKNKNNFESIHNGSINKLIKKESEDWMSIKNNMQKSIINSFTWSQEYLEWKNDKEKKDLEQKNIEKQSKGLDKFNASNGTIINMNGSTNYENWTYIFNYAKNMRNNSNNAKKEFVQNALNELLPDLQSKYKYNIVIPDNSKIRQKFSGEYYY